MCGIYPTFIHIYISIQCLASLLNRRREQKKGVVETLFADSVTT